MLASIAANAGPSRAPSQKVPALGTSTSRSPATPIKFSDDTARLQQINSIRKAPIGSQIKRVIDLLREERQAFTPEQINERTHVDINGNRAVFDSLSKNPKVKYDGYCFSYKRKAKGKRYDRVAMYMKTHNSSNMTTATRMDKMDAIVCEVAEPERTPDLYEKAFTEVMGPDAIGKQVVWPLSKLKPKSPVTVKQEKLKSK